MMRLKKLLAIRPSEGRLVALVLGTMLLTSAGSALGSAGIETLFFTRFGVRYLPSMYMLLGVVTIGVSLGMAAWPARLPPRRLYVLLPFLLAVLLILARLLLLSKLPLVYPILWLGKEVINSLVGILVWGAASTVCEARQARRLFPLFNAGRILGSVLGGLSTGWLVSRVGTENLVVPWIAAMLLAFLFIRWLLGGQVQALSRERKSHAAQGFVQQLRQGYRSMRASTLMRWVALASLLFSILYFSLALPFSRVAAVQFPDEAALAAFLGAFQGLSTAAAFLASLLLANRLFARFGIMNMLLVFPLIYLAGFGAMALAPVFAVIVSFRFVQTLWLSGIADPAYQAMFNVIPPGRREQVRAFMNVPNQVGTFIAGLVLFIGEQAFMPSQLALFGFLVSAGCAFVIWQSRRAYNFDLLEALRLGRPHIFFREQEPFRSFRGDAAAMGAVLAGARSDDLAARRVSVEILGQMNSPEAMTALARALQDPDAYVRLLAARGLAGSSPADFLAGLERLLSDPDDEVRLESLSCLAGLGAPSAELLPMLEGLLADPDPRLRARAAGCLLKAGAHDGALRLLQELVRSGEAEACAEALEAIPADFDLVAAQLAHPQASVRRAAAQALVRLDASSALPRLLPLLGDPALRGAVSGAIGGMGEAAAPVLLEALTDPGLEAGALEALGYLPALDPQPVESYARASVAGALHYQGLAGGLRPDQPRQALLQDLLHEKARAHAVHALQAIGLLTSRGAIPVVLENLASTDRVQQANALEILESLPEKQRAIIRPLLPLWEQTAAASLQPAHPSALASDPDPWVRACAAFAATSGDIPMDNLPTLSLMERVLFLRRVPLFAGLSTSDLKDLAAIAEEMLFADGEQIARQDEPGEVMHLVISGDILVQASQAGGEVRQIARRGPGDIVGEMALISDVPRMANLLAAGDVRTLCIDRRSFQALLRERPEVSLAVMQVLSRRIREMAQAA